MPLLISTGEKAMSHYQLQEESQEEVVPKYLYKILSPEDWEKSREGARVVPCVGDEDFIHFAREDQLERILTKYWSSKPFIVLKIESAKLEGKLVFEPNAPGGAKYYHLYEGAIPLESVVEIRSPHV